MAPLAATVDAHHHLWRYAEEEYSWIDDSMKAIRRDFLPEHLAEQMQVARVAQTVVVQARQTLAETDWLLDLADATPFIGGVVGWLPLSADDLDDRVEYTTAKGKLVGVRHIVQSEPGGFLDTDTFNRGIRTLTRRNLRYDLLIYPSQLDEAVRFVDRHPNQLFVLDHCGKPPIAAGKLQPWRSKLLELGIRENVYCKISGLLTESDWRHWTLDTLRPYLETALEGFGADRCMAGSDWPVMLLASTYLGWWEALRSYASELTATEQVALLGGTAKRFYALPDTSSGDAR